MLGRCAFDISCSRVDRVIKTMTGFMLLYAFGERSASLSNVERITISTGNFIYDVLLLLGWGRSFRMGQNRSQGVS